MSKHFGCTQQKGTQHKKSILKENREGDKFSKIVTTNTARHIVHKIYYAAKR
jgi:hypothetical protein